MTNNLKFNKKSINNKTLISLFLFFISPYSYSDVYGDNTVTFNESVGAYWYSHFKSDFGNVSEYSNAEKERSIVTSSETLQVTLLKDAIGQTGGIIANVEINNGTEYILKYKVKFQDGFEWAKGGKLPGLGGGAVHAGGSDTSEGDGWSFRPVWHLYSGINDDQPWISPYAYYVDQPSTYGDEFGERYTIVDNQWYNIWINITMNTESNYDGKIHMKINNSTVYYDDSFRWVTDDSGREIDEFMWDIFRGGATSEYESENDNIIYFDEIMFEKIQ